MTEIADAVELFKTIADPKVVAAADKLVADDNARWVLDPHLVGVVGLVELGMRFAYVVVYLADRDFEINEALEQLIA